MKKFAAWLLVAVLICCQFSVMTAFAADTTVTTDVPASTVPSRPMSGDAVSLSLTPADSTLKAGDTFTVSLDVTANHYLVNGFVQIAFDSTLLELVEINPGDVDFGYVAEVNDTVIPNATWAFRQTAAGTYGFVFATGSSVGAATAGTIFPLTFKVLEGWVGKTAIEVTAVELDSCNAAGGVSYSTNVTLNNAFVTVEEESEETITVGVNEIDGEYYYVNSDGSYKTGKFWVTATGANGYVTAGYVYADETGRFYNNEFYTIDGALYYMEKGQPTTNTGVREINGNLYSLNYKGKVNIGEIYVTAAGSNGLVTEGYCYTDETGRFYNNEFATLPDGVSYYMINGRPQRGEGGVREIDGDLYYVSWTGTVVTGKVFVSNGNGYTERGNHYTDETGRFYNEEFATIDGVLYYMVKGRPMQNGGGVEMIDGNLYYITWRGTVLTGEIYVSNGNGYTERGRHYTDETGRFYNDEFVTMDGKIYYLVNGRIYNTPGVIEVDGELYYATWEGPIATGEVYVTYTNGLIETTGWHFADETGRFLDNEFTLASDGKTYYVVKGAKYTTGGVLEVDGNYYYVSWNSSIVISGTVNITTSNSNGYDVPTGRYTTDENGVIQF